ncbi:MAG: hypothetical protein V3U02_12605 [Calditrichia bacterium]
MHLSAFSETPIPYMFDSSDDFDFNSVNGLLGAIPKATSDKGLEEAYKALLRGAAVDVLKREGITTMQAITEADRILGNEIFEDDVEERMIDGLHAGDLDPLTEQQMESEIQKQFRIELGDLGYGQLGWNPFKAIAKTVKKAAKKIVTAKKKFSRYVGKRATAIRKGATRAAFKLRKGATKAFKTVVNLHKKAFFGVAIAVGKIAKRHLPLIKKVAIVAAIGAAIWFGGPILIAAAAKAGPLLLAKAKALGPIAAKVMAKLGIGKGEITDPNDPRLAQVNTEIQMEVLSQQGVNMESPEAVQMLNQYGQLQNQKLLGAKPPMDIGKMLMVAAPIAAAVMFMG